MTFNEFKRRLFHAKNAGVLLSTNEPVLITEGMAEQLVEAVLVTRGWAKENNFSGRIFVTQLPLGEGEFTMLIGVSPDMPDSHEVTL